MFSIKRMPGYRPWRAQVRVGNDIAHNVGYASAGAAFGALRVGIALALIEARQLPS